MTTTRTVALILIVTETIETPSSSSFPAAVDTDGESVEPKPLAKCTTREQRNRAVGSR